MDRPVSEMSVARRIALERKVQTIRDRAQRQNTEGATIMEALDILRERGTITDAEHDFLDLWMHQEGDWDNG